MDLNFNAEDIIDEFFKGPLELPDPKWPQEPQMPGAQGWQGLPTIPTSAATPSTSAATTPASTSTTSTSAATTPTSRSKSTSSVRKIVRGESRSSPSTSSGFDADKQIRSRDNPPQGDGKAQTNPSMSTDITGHLLLSPDMDMSTAIALSQKLKNNGKRSYSIAFGDDDNPAHRPRFMSIDDACQIPEKKLRDELVKLYFEHFHPFCPVVDEYDFMEIYNEIEDDEQLKSRIELPLFQAMIKVAFGHLPGTRLRSTPYRSIYEAQKAYFDKASLLYRVRYTSDHLVLTKVALLLTFWSPFDAERQVNNYWVDRALYHARAIRLSDSQGETDVMSGRRRIIWWCCLLRDRLISVALRRFYRIHEAKSTWPIVTEADFGPEAMFPKFMTVKRKRAVLQSFIWWCSLSDIVRDIAVFQEKKRFDREWSDSLTTEDAIVAELAQVSQFDNRLKSWKEGYLQVNSDYINSIKPGTSKLPNHVLIIGDSIVTTLYLPYIHCPSGSVALVQRFQKVALRRIKIAASAVALHVRKLNSATKVEEEFVVGVCAWIALPMAVFKVPEETDGDVSHKANGGCHEDFVPFLSAFAARFYGAKLLADMMGEKTSEIVERSTNLGVARKDAQQRPHGGKSSEVDEAEVLNVVAKMVDLHLSTDVSTQM